MAGSPRSVTEVRDALSDTINEVAYAGGRIVLERRGKNVCAIISMDDLALLEALEDRLDVQAARKALREPGSKPWAKVKEGLGLAKQTKRRPRRK